MKSRYDYMRASPVTDIDGEQFPDPLTINYEGILEKEVSIPAAYTLSVVNLRKLWWKYYTESGREDLDDVQYDLNMIEHVGELEPGDQILLFDLSGVEEYKFKDLEQGESNV